MPGTRLQIKIILLVKLIIIQKTKTLIFHSEKNPLKQNTEPIPQSFSSKKVFCKYVLNFQKNSNVDLWFQ